MNLNCSVTLEKLDTELTTPIIIKRVWYKNYRLLPSNITKERFRFLSEQNEKSIALKIVDLKSEDNGIYQCMAEATNPNGEALSKQIVAPFLLKVETNETNEMIHDTFVDGNHNISKNNSFNDNKFVEKLNTISNVIININNKSRSIYNQEEEPDYSIENEDDDDDEEDEEENTFIPQKLVNNVTLLTCKLTKSFIFI